MYDLKKRVVAGILGCALILALTACGPDEDPAGTTAPSPDSSTSEPVGS